MMDIPDINVWLALVDENHVHHQAALAYWHGQRTDQVMFCRVTMMGLLRLSTQPHVLSRTLTNAEAWDIYQRYRATAPVQFLAEPLHLERHLAALISSAEWPNRLWTDAYLAALAMAANARLVSFDGDFKRFAELNFLHLTLSAI
jgi:uncharacterized protein